MRLLAPALVLLAALAGAAPSYDQSAALNAERTAITSDFSAAQAALRSAKTTAASDAANLKLEDVAKRAVALRDRVVQANSSLVTILSTPPFAGQRDSSATIKSTHAKLGSINSGLSSLGFTASPPFQPKDINAVQVILDRCKTGIEEHRHAAQNIETRLLELQRGTRRSR